jgi:hypothetical protein
MPNFLKRLRFPLVITYDSKLLPDGFGAQAIRLIGIYSIANRFHLQYRHQEIEYIPEEELIGFPYDKVKYHKVLTTLNCLTRLPNEVSLRKPLKEKAIRRRNITRRSLTKLVLLSIVLRFFRKQRVVLHLCLPQGITDTYPNILDIGASVIRTNLEHSGYRLNNGHIVVHLRGGLRVVDVTRPQLSPPYYSSTLQALSSKRNSWTSIKIHTDFFEQDLIKYKSNLRVQVYTQWLQSLQTKYFDTKILYYSPILSVLQDMICADVLVMSNSSLSYFAGLINPNKVIWPPIHAHSKLRRWSFGPILDESIFIDPNHIPYTNWDEIRG